MHGTRAASIRSRTPASSTLALTPHAERRPLSLCDALGSRDLGPISLQDHHDRWASHLDKLNWQSVLFLGYGDDRTLDAEGDPHRSGQQFFLKLSYALQR